MSTVNCPHGLSRIQFDRVRSSVKAGSSRADNTVTDYFSLVDRVIQKLTDAAK